MKDTQRYIGVLRKKDRYNVKQKERLSLVLIEKQLEQEIEIETYVSKKAMHIETARDRGVIKIQTCIYSHDQV